MAEKRICPKCETELPVDAPVGICPRCLMLAGLNPQADSDPFEHESAYVRTTPQPGSFVAPSPHVLAPHFPQLELSELLGQGGMGAVYKARQTKLDRMVALKIIRPESATDSAFAERFNREARTLARLNHPNIVSVHDFGEVTIPDPADPDASHITLYYFLMEYVDGANLRQLIQAGELDPELTLQVVPQICEALQFAHDEGIVHRDIKPENILLDRKGRVKIADFGLAKLATRSDQDFTLTGTHQVMGTPRYMAPEQMEGSRTVDHRADIYSLGVVFYEMLTGETPAGHFEPPSRKAAIDVRLDEIVLRAMAREPERRYQHVSEMSRQVNGLRSDSSLSNVGSIAESSRPWPGASTILERAVGDFVGGVRGGLNQPGLSGSLTNPILVGLITMGLSLVVLTTLLFPWGYTHQNSGIFWIYAHWDSWGILAGIDSFVLGLLMLVSTSSHLRPRWRPWAILILSGVLLFFLGLFYENRLDPFSIHASSAYLTAFGSAIVLAILGAWDLRCLLARAENPPRRKFDTVSTTDSRVRESTFDDIRIRRTVRGPGIAMVLFGLCLLFPALLLFTNGFDIADGNDGLPGYIGLLMIAGSLLVVGLSGLLIRGGWHLSTLEKYRPALLASILGQPIGLWGLSVLGRPEVKRAFSIGQPDAVQAVEPTHGARIRESDTFAKLLGKTALQAMTWIGILGAVWFLLYLARGDSKSATPGRDSAVTSITVEDAAGNSISQLHAAVARGDAGRMKELLETGASVSDKDSQGRTPLMLAAANGHASLAATLMLLGANINEKDKAGMTSMMYAVENGHESVRNAIEEVIKASQVSNEEDRIDALTRLPGIDRRLIEGLKIDVEKVEFDPLAQDHDGETVLMKAVKSQNFAYLRDAKYNHEAVQFPELAPLQDHEGNTPLMHAILLNAPNYVRRIFEVGKEYVYVTETNGFIPDYKLNPMFDPRALSRTNKEGLTALQLAEKLGQHETANLIRDEMNRIIELATKTIERDDVEFNQKKDWLKLRRHAYLAIGEREKADADFQSARE